MPISKTHYEALQVSPTADQSVIRACYKVLAQKYHPDKKTVPAAIAHRVMADLNEAYRVLSDPAQRAVYDRQIEVLNSEQHESSSRHNDSRNSSNPAWEDVGPEPQSTHSNPAPGQFASDLLVRNLFVSCVISASFFVVFIFVFYREPQKSNRLLGEETSKVAYSTAAALVHPITSDGPSFDCARVSLLPVEQRICNSPALISLDVELNRAYAAARKRSAKPVSLRKAQLDWLKDERNHCIDDICLLNQYRQRIETLLEDLPQ